MREYSVYGKYDTSTIRRFGPWSAALEKAGISIVQQFWSVEQLYENIENVWIKKGAQPRRRDMDNHEISDISSGAYLRRFGKWSSALEEFIRYINQDEDNDEINFPLCNSIEGKYQFTTRDINLRLRFKVLQRDNFKCCACGASPAKDPSVVLHIDHIVPWSKGGETVMENLQTLCSKCNLGKGDMTE